MNITIELLQQIYNWTNSSYLKEFIDGRPLEQIKYRVVRDQCIFAYPGGSPMYCLPNGRVEHDNFLEGFLQGISWEEFMLKMNKLENLPLSSDEYSTQFNIIMKKYVKPIEEFL